MADPLLTSLCSICHTAKPKYKCPRCATQTCSLPCTRKHKAWADCSGERDATAYRPIKELRTAAGIDHDYNFLHKIETRMERTERELVDEKGIIREEELRRKTPTVQEVRWKVGRDGRRRRVVVTRELRDTSATGTRTFEKMLAQRLRKLDVRILTAPMGMQRQKENRTTFNRKTWRVNWQVEWLVVRGGETHRVLGKVMDDVPLYEGYYQCLEEEEETQKGKRTKSRNTRFTAQNVVDATWNTALDVMQEPTTGRWVSAAAVAAASGLWPDEVDRARRDEFDYFLANPRQRSDKPRVVTKLEMDDCLREVLRGTNVLEFPTVYMVERGTALPEGLVLGPKDLSTAPARGMKRKEGPARTGRATKKRQLEDGEVDGAEEEEDDGPGVGLEAGDVLAEESFDEDDDEDEDDATSSSGTDSEAY